MSYDINCEKCPYINQSNLTVNQKTKREKPPIELENNESDVLLIFQAPGTEEWEEGKAIQPTTKQGGTAGKRIQSSWERKDKKRSDFNIINAVQCFPGKESKRDFQPNIKAICSCSKRLENILLNKQYRKIITFGKIAEELTNSILKSLKVKPVIINMIHPTGGLKNIDLDNLW